MLMLSSRGPLGGYIDRYTTTYEEIAYVLHILSIYRANVRSRTDINFYTTFGSVFYHVIS